MNEELVEFARQEQSKVITEVRVTLLELGKLLGAPRDSHLLDRLSRELNIEMTKVRIRGVGGWHKSVTREDAKRMITEYYRRV